MRLTIRGRLTLWNTLALACVLALFGALVYWLLLQTHQRIDQALRDRVEQALGRIDQSLLQQFQQLQKDPQIPNEPVKRLSHWIYEFKEHDNIFCVVYDSAGKAILRTEEMAASSVPEAPVKGTSPQYREASVPALGRQRVLQGSLRAGNQEYEIVLLASLNQLDREREEVQREHAGVHREFRGMVTILLAFVPVTLILVAGVGYFLARKALAPMDKLNRLAEGITAQRLDRRLPVIHAEDELGRLTATINAMIARLEGSFKEIQRFTADASHELRTPLTAIRAEAEIASTKPLTVVEHQHLLASILEECERLTRLTDQLLTLSREDAGAIERTRDTLDVLKMVQQVTENMKPLADAKGLYLRLTGSGPLTSAGDENRLREVVINLLDNAIKYTPKDGEVHIDVQRRRRTVLIRVTDTGIGIFPEHQPRVFERFYRVDKTRSRVEGGTGLGLSIARSIIQSHGGTISLASEPGHGTTVTVTLPMTSDPTNSL